jgi:hypothetical protein
VNQYGDVSRELIGFAVPGDLNSIGFHRLFLGEEQATSQDPPWNLSAERRLLPATGCSFGIG